MVDARKSVAQGVFYPSDEVQLDDMVRTLLDSAAREATQPTRRVRGIVVPHGAYAAAGAVLAAAWAHVCVHAGSVRRVALLGPAHHVLFAGIAAPFADAFCTPLGNVEIDRIAIETLRRFPQVVVNDAPHDQEHSLEVQLPFLQTVLPSAAVIPLVVGETSDAEAAAVVDALWDDGTLAVVSTDMSQYYSAHAARRIDEDTSRAIESAQAAQIGQQQACGHTALRALLLASRLRDLRTTRVAMYHAGDHDEVTGFGAFLVE